MNITFRYQPIRPFAYVLLLVAFTPRGIAECRDFDAITAADKKALSYFNHADVFHPGVILKVHHPSGKKEVASYIKSTDKYYSIFTLVDHECVVQFRKRTRQGD